MSLLHRLREFIAPTPADITSPEEKRRIEDQQREVRARLRMLELEGKVITQRKVSEWKRGTS